MDLLNLDNIVGSTTKVGEYSNGEDFNTLAGKLALVPLQFAVVSHLEITFYGLDHTNQISSSDVDVHAEGGYSIFSASADVKVHHETTSDKKTVKSFTIQVGAPVLLGVLVQKQPLFPKPLASLTSEVNASIPKIYVDLQNHRHKYLLTGRRTLTHNDFPYISLNFTTGQIYY